MSHGVSQSTKSRFQGGGETWPREQPVCSCLGPKSPRGEEQSVISQEGLQDGEKGVLCLSRHFFTLQVCCVPQRSEQVSVHFNTTAGHEVNGGRVPRQRRLRLPRELGGGGRCDVSSQPGPGEHLCRDGPSALRGQGRWYWGLSPFVSNCLHSPPVCPTTGFLSTRRVWRLDRTQGLEHTVGCRARGQADK